MPKFKKTEPTRHEVQGQTVLIRPMTAGELAALIHDVRDGKVLAWQGDFRMIACCTLDTQGQPLFASAEAIQDESPETVGELLALVMTANGIGQQSKKNDA